MSYRNLIALALAGAAAVAVGTTAARAADLPVAQPIAPVPLYDWSGFYVGAQAGYAFGSADYDFALAGFGSFITEESDADGFIGGGHVGYQFQMNRVVVGLEGDIEGTTIDGDVIDFTGVTAQGSVDVNVQGSLRLRAGYAFDRFLPYLTGGLAVAGVDYTGGPAGGPVVENSETRTGWTVGAGMQYAFTDIISAGVEYRYTDYGEADFSLAPIFPAVTETVDLHNHAIRGRVSISFGPLLR